MNFSITSLFEKEDGNIFSQ